ncbi:hypothetical protein LXL04_001521 [Taraxacum kok-saghyz]
MLRVMMAVVKGLFKTLEGRSYDYAPKVFADLASARLSADARSNVHDMTNFNYSDVIPFREEQVVRFWYGGCIAYAFGLYVRQQNIEVIQA